MQFFRYHAIGNDYIVIREEDVGGAMTPALARRICHRNYGVGSDGILLHLRDAPGRFSLRIFNPDWLRVGKERQRSADLRPVPVGPQARKRRTVCRSYAGRRVTCRVVDDGRVVTVDMGTLTFDSARIPVAGPRREVLRERLTIAGAEFEYSCASIGNPHCVLLRDALSEDETRAIGPLVEVEPRFPNRTNVQFMQVLDRRNIAIQIWERGAGFTLASGSSSSAEPLVSRTRLGLCDADNTVHMPGGTIRIEIDPRFAVRMTGPGDAYCGWNHRSGEPGERGDPDRMQQPPA
jgi:diaminopimelate epimerase